MRRRKSVKSVDPSSALRMTGVWGAALWVWLLDRDARKCGLAMTVFSGGAGAMV